MANTEQDNKARANTLNTIVKVAIAVIAFATIAYMLFPSGISAEYTDTGVVVRGGGHRTEIDLDQVTGVQLTSGPFELGEAIDAVDKGQFYAGLYQGGSLPDVSSYMLYLDYDYVGDIVVVSYVGETGDETMVVGSGSVDMLFIYDYLRQGAGME